MRKPKFDSRELRRLAEGVLRRIAEDGLVPAGGRADAVTSLVRQWVTYDGVANLFVGERRAYFTLERTPLGKTFVDVNASPHGWERELTADWKIPPEALPDLFDQLNRGQSAEVVNGDGVALRLWVNPKKRQRGVETLDRKPAPPGTVRDERKIAAGALARHFGDTLGPEELDQLARSVADQWRRFEGNACVFLDTARQLHFRITPRGDGSELAVHHLRTTLARVLSECGFPPDGHTAVIAQLNLGREIEFRDRQGVRSRLSYDPKLRRFHALPLDPVPPPAVALPPFLCPNCTAVLRPWRDGEREQTCALCGHTTSLR